MRHEIRLRDSIALSSVALLAFACVNLGPTASQSLSPGTTSSPGATLPGATTSLAPSQSPVATVPVISAPPTTPTLPPTATPTDAPTATPTDAPTATPTDAPTDTPTDGPTPTPAEELNFRLDPNYGLVELEAGFVPDPHSREMTAGGPVDASYLGGDCVGFASSAPDYSVRYTAGDRPLLRFYFLADLVGDATMIINDPDGDWLCNDDWDSSTVDPGIDVADPEGGRYDIWVGVLAEGTNVDGVLYVTELGSNQP